MGFGVAFSHSVFETGSDSKMCQNWVCEFVFVYVHKSACVLRL